MYNKLSGSLAKEVKMELYADIMVIVVCAFMAGFIYLFIFEQ